MPAVLVVADEFFALACAGDGEGVLMFVSHGATAFVSFHGDVAPHAAVGSMAGDVEHFLFLRLFAYGGTGCWLGRGCRFDYLNLWLGLWLGFEGYCVVNRFGRGLRPVAAEE